MDNIKLSEKLNTPNSNSQPKNCWIFDVDGVITNPTTKRVEKPEIIKFIIGKLKFGEPVAFITGRALSWVMENIVPLLKEEAKDQPKILDNFFISAEFGDAHVLFKDGNHAQFGYSNIKVPEVITTDAKQAMKPFSSTHFLDDTKKTMVSFEMIDGLNVEDFWPEQKKLAEKLREIVLKHDPNGQYEVFEDRIATDIRDKRSNKSFATEQVVKWVKNNISIFPVNFFVFGDNKGDAEIPIQLTKMGFKTQFVFVGGQNQLEGLNLDFPVIFTQKLCDEGVTEFIKNFDLQGQTL